MLGWAVSLFRGGEIESPFNVFLTVLLTAVVPGDSSSPGKEGEEEGGARNDARPFPRYPGHSFLPMSSFQAYCHFVGSPSSNSL